MALVKLNQYFIASNDAATALENLQMLEPITQKEQSDKLKIDSALKTLIILLSKVNSINQQMLKDLKD